MKPDSQLLITSDMKEVAWYGTHGRVPTIRPIERLTATTAIVGSRPYYRANGSEKGGYGTRCRVAPVTVAVRDHIAAAALADSIKELQHKVSNASAGLTRRHIQVATSGKHETSEVAAKEAIANLLTLLAEYEKAAQLADDLVTGAQP